ncbi:TPA: DnaB-like helicase C-terminal domain-containing protein, partial [Streptococcus suis]
HLKDYVDEISVHSKKGDRESYICPLCGSGNGKNKTGAFFINKTGLRWKCFACDKSGDLLDLIGYVEGIEDFNDQLRRGGELFNIPVEFYPNNIKPFILPQKKNNGEKMENIEKQDYTTFFKEAHANIHKTDYAHKRGLSDEILEKFMIGYVESWKHPNAPQNISGSPRLIIPVTKDSYFARDTREVIPEFQQKYAKSKVGGSNIFNAKALKSNLNQPIFVVEGEIDALSVMEVGAVAVGLGSTSNTQKFIDLVSDKELKCPLLLAFDNDTAGKNAQEELAKQLKEKNIPYKAVSLVNGDIKDPNAMLMKDRETFSKLVAKALENSKSEKERYLNLSAGKNLQNFVDGITDSVNTPYIPTKFKGLDELLDGGLYEGLYIVGAISSLGKTTLVTQIADQIAEQGFDVLIISLEMARNEIIAKSISRNTIVEVIHSGGNTRNAKTVRGITTGRKYPNYNETELELIKTAINNYGNFADHIFIVEGIGNIGVKEVRTMVEKHIQYTGNTPVLIIDYLQILAPFNDRATDKQNTDKAVLELKRISRDFKMPVIGISSFNRDNYNNPVGMQSFKESGAIEYSSDVLIGLQFKGVGESGFDSNEAKASNPREVELVILKNRNGQTGTKLEFDFYAMFNYFEERNK